MRILSLAPVVAISVAALALTGCAGFQTNIPAAPVTITGASFTGNVHGGQQPVAGATVQLYQAGTTGYGVGAVGLIANGGVQTTASGSFNITNDYTCTPGTQIYIVATGGNPGSGINNALSLITALGPCANVPQIPFVQINEVTTVATVYALAPFMNGTNIGAPSTNATGLAQAFADFNTLANFATGTSPGAGLPTGTSVPTQEIYALSNSIAACVNSSGTGGGGACDMLFAATTENGATPADTVSATVNIARFPGANAQAILQLGSGTPPFPSNFTSANDLTLAVTYTGSGLSAPTGVAIDAGGNVWVSNSGSNSVTELTHAGAPLSGAAGYAAGVLSTPSAVAIDLTGNAWIANSGNASVSRISASGATTSYTGGGLAGPSSIAIDALGNVWLSNAGNNSVSEFSSMGAPLSPTTTGYAASGVAAPVAIAIDPH